MDIVIYTRPETLSHKKGEDGGKDYYWYFERPPKKFERGERVYFAVKGFVVGSFRSYYFNPFDDETVCWECKTWEEMKNPIPTKPFRNFRYKWW